VKRDFIYELNTMCRRHQHLTISDGPKRRAEPAWLGPWVL
jgi:hypothetical protein